MRRRAVPMIVAALAVAVAANDLWLAAFHRRGPQLTEHLERLADARLLLVLSALTLVWVHRPLVRSKRNAAIVAGVAAVLSLLVDPYGWHALPPVALLGALAVTHRRFTAAADPAASRDGLRLFVVGGLTIAAYGTIAITVLSDEFTGAVNPGNALVETLRMMLLLDPEWLEPIGHHGRWVVVSIHLGALAVALTTVVKLVATVVRPQHAHDRATVEQLLEEWATTSVAPFELLDDKSWWFTDERDAFVGYTTVGSTAIALGDPIGPPDRLAAAIRGFVEHCADNGWTPAFHQLTPAGAELAREAGLQTMKIGEEAIVDVRSWTDEGPHYKSLRSACRRVERAGLRIVELPQPLSAEDLHALKRVSDAWMADGRHRERTFTLGQFDPEQLRASRVLALSRAGGGDADHGEIVAFVTIIPSYRSGIGNFDLMRRTPDSPNGTMEYLFVALIAHFRAEGYRGMTLGLSPFANVTGDGLPERALRMLYERGNRMFNYQGLREFKDKWQPAWEPRYLAYTTAAELPRTALAISRAGELGRGHSMTRRIARVGRAYPVTLGIASLIAWFTAVTYSSPRSYQRLVHYLALSVHDLQHLRLWRLATSQLVAPDNRPNIAELLLVVTVMALVEHRFGSRRTLLTFFGCDWVSTLSVIAAAEVLQHAFGIEQAVLTGHDSGTSAGMWALIITFALSIEHRRTRAVLCTFSFGFLAFQLITRHDLAAVQHVVAVAVALLISALARRRTPAPGGRRTPQALAATGAPTSP